MRRVLVWWVLPVLAVAALGAGCFGLAQIDWSKALSCPTGQHVAVIIWIPISTGKTVIITPIYGCQS